MTETKRTRTVLGLVLAAVLLAVSACGNGSDKPGASDKPSSKETSEGAPQAQEPDLDGVPDVVAEVNGEEVTKDEFAAAYSAQLQQAAMQAQASGQQPDADAVRKQTAEILVDTELLTQEAESRDIAVSDEDVDDELAALAKQNQLASADELLAALEKQGTSEEQARDQVETQMLVEQLVADEDGPVEPTEKDLRTLYQQAKQQQAQMGQQQQKLPPYDEVKPQLEQQARTDRVGEVAQTMIEDLRKDADITINL